MTSSFYYFLHKMTSNSLVMSWLVGCTNKILDLTTWQPFFEDLPSSAPAAFGSLVRMSAKSSRQKTRRSTKQPHVWDVLSLVFSSLSNYLGNIFHINSCPRNGGHLFVNQVFNGWCFDCFPISNIWCSNCKAWRQHHKIFGRCWSAEGIQKEVSL